MEERTLSAGYGTAPNRTGAIWVDIDESEKMVLLCAEGHGFRFPPDLARLFADEIREKADLLTEKPRLRATK